MRFADDMKDVPGDYYRRLQAIERDHWWRTGMQEITAALLRGRLDGARLGVLDAGCGTGGFLAWLVERWSFERVAGVDLSDEAIALASDVLPGADLRVMGLTTLPFADGAFDLVTLNDVLQHVHEDVVLASLRELRRVLAPGGTLLVRTNGGRRARLERGDWRLYDEGSLRAELGRAGLHVDRATYANMLLSLVGSLRGCAPRAPTSSSCGVPKATGAVVTIVGRGVLGLEARFLRRPGRHLPFGHTLFAVARRSDVAGAAGPAS